MVMITTMCVASVTHMTSMRVTGAVMLYQLRNVLNVQRVAQVRSMADRVRESTH